MAGPVPPRARDELVLEALHLRDHEGLSGPVIAKRLGFTRSALAGLFKRVRDDDDVAGDATRHLDGSLGPRWWAGRARCRS